MGHKPAETTHNINNTFGPGTANKHTVQRWFKKFCTGDKSLEDEKHSGQPSEVDNDQLRAIIEADPLTATKELNVNHYMVTRHLQQTGRAKDLNKWAPRELMENQKITILLKCPMLLFYTTATKHVSVGLCNEKWILYDNW